MVSAPRKTSAQWWLPSRHPQQRRVPVGAVWAGETPGSQGTGEGGRASRGEGDGVEGPAWEKMQGRVGLPARVPGD